MPAFPKPSATETETAARITGDQVDVVTKTTTYSLTGNDQTVLADATSGAFTLTLPTAVGFKGRYAVKVISTAGYVVTVATTSAQTIDGASTLSLSPFSAYSAVELVSDGANWRTV